MNIYQQQILDHYKNPRNYVKHEALIHNFSHSGEAENVSCGDTIKLFLQVGEENDKITSVKFNGEGCSIAIATASILSEYLVEKSLTQALSMTEKDLLKLIGIELTPSRQRCATLSLLALQRALTNDA